MSAATLRERLAALPPLPPEPQVSVLVAVRNEARHLEAALAAVCAQDWPLERLEILVIDGDSGDGTREVAARIAAADPRVRVLANPARFVAQGLNVGLAAARGEVIVRVDGHCRVPAGYVRAGVEALRAGSGECAGGPVRALGGSAIGRAIALAMSTPFGVGGASFRWARQAREVDHLPFGIWRREVFEWLGGFDESLRRNQDDEFSDRFRRAGGRIWMQPEALVDYWSRDSLAGLAQQYFGYGFWKVRVIRKRGGMPSSLRHLAPAALWLATMGGALAALAARVPLLAAIVPGAYGVFLALATLVTLVSRWRSEALLLPVVLPVLHGAYGLGFLAALARPADEVLRAEAETPSAARAA